MNTAFYSSLSSQPSTHVARRQGSLPRALPVGALWVALALGGCPGATVADAGPSANDDAGTETTPDAGQAVVDAGPPAPTVVEILSDYLSGEFDTENQSNSNPAYYNITLSVCDVEVPELGDHVLYVEQAVAGGDPYRQRLYVLEAGETDNSAVSYVYSFPNPAAFTGTCSGTATAEVTFADATLRSGCEVYVTYENEVFTGGTQGTDCSSSLNGANYAISDVTIEKEMLSSWDRGYVFGAQGGADVQVWGAEAGPYQFDRKSPFGE